MGRAEAIQDLYQILLGYQFSRVNAIRPYGLAFWESEFCDSDLVWQGIRQTQLTLGKLERAARCLG